MIKHNILLLVLIEAVLFVTIIVVGFNIMTLLNDKNDVKGTVAIIEKENLSFDNKNLKYFFEPKPNTKEIDNPSWIGHAVEYTINSDSLNERMDYTEQKPSNTYRIISLGASYTFGQYVNTSENYSEVLEDMLNSRLKCEDIEHFEVINLGVRAYDIEYTVERFRNRGVKYQPDLVLWLFTDGNFERINELIFPIEETLSEKGIPEFDEKTQSYLKNSMAIDEFNTKYSESFLLDYQTEQMQKIKKYYKGTLILLAYQTFKLKFQNIVVDFIVNNNNAHFFNKLIDIPSIKSYQLVGGHPTPDGHRKIAEDLFTYLVDRNIICGAQ